MSAKRPNSPRAGTSLGWSCIKTESDIAVIRQVGNTCGQCTATMLLLQLGIPVTVGDVINVIGHDNDTAADELIAALSLVAKNLTFRAEIQDDEDESDKGFALYHPNWWMGMMMDSRSGSHWLLVRGHGDSEILEVLDSADGSRSLVSWSEFSTRWNRIVVRAK